MARSKAASARTPTREASTRNTKREVSDHVAEAGENGITVAELARETGVSPKQVRYWLKEFAHEFVRVREYYDRGGGKGFTHRDRYWLQQYKAIAELHAEKQKRKNSAGTS